MEEVLEVCEEPINVLCAYAIECIIQLGDWHCEGCSKFKDYREV